MTQRLAAPGDRITRHGMRYAHTVRRLRNGVTQSASAGPSQTRPFAETRCRIPMWGVLADGPTDEWGVSWIAPPEMPDCQGCAVRRSASKRGQRKESGE